jgi:predicted nucleic acid-binding protein
LGAVTALAGHQRIYFDANVFIYVVEAIEPYVSALHPVLTALADLSIEVITSELTLAEVLVKPIGAGDARIQDAYNRFLYRTAGLSTVPVDRDILTEAARLRAAQNIRLADAIHAATARQCACSAMLTNDARLRTPGVTTVPVSALPVPPA